MIACDQARREERFRTASDLAGYFRKPYGPGWALVGDAGYHLHPITAQGITDAFLDAERLTDALDAAFTERSTYDDAMAAYQAARDEQAMPMYEMTFDFAQVDQPPPPETQQLLGAVAGNQQAMDDFVSVQAGTMPIPEFFSPDEHRPHHGRPRAAGIAAHRPFDEHDRMRPALALPAVNGVPDEVKEELVPRQGTFGVSGRGTRSGIL